MESRCRFYERLPNAEIANFAIDVLPILRRTGRADNNSRTGQANPRTMIAHV